MISHFSRRVCLLECLSAKVSAKVSAFDCRSCIVLLWQLGISLPFALADIRPGSLIIIVSRERVEFFLDQDAEQQHAQQHSEYNVELCFSPNIILDP